MNKALLQQLEALKSASFSIQTSTLKQRNYALKLIKEALLKNTPAILNANQKDLKKMKTNDPMIDRLLLNVQRIKAMAAEIDTIIGLTDPLGRVLESSQGPSGIQLKKISVPLGCIGVIYESRPNVTIDVTALCLKSGNAVLLRGGSDAWESNSLLISIIQQALKASEIPTSSVQLMSPARELLPDMLSANRYLDLIIPRGSQGLIQFVRDNATVPSIETGASVVHTFVDASAKIPMACRIIHNEKTRRPSVCNAVDTILVHQKIAEKFLPEMAKIMKENGTVLHTDRKSLKLLRAHYPKQLLIDDADRHYDHEFLSLQMNIRMVKNIDEAIDHIRTHSLKHSESIVTQDRKNAQRFQAEVDAACVYVNTSTAFSDGAEFGLGSEIGISTQKLHARGPMGLKELTSYKWLIESKGLIRK